MYVYCYRRSGNRSSSRERSRCSFIFAKIKITLLPNFLVFFLTDPRVSVEWSLFITGNCCRTEIASRQPSLKFHKKTGNEFQTEIKVFPRRSYVFPLDYVTVSRRFRLKTVWVFIATVSKIFEKRKQILK